jgi:hypothetical protein
VTHHDPTTGGRRSAAAPRGRLSLTVVLAVVLPLLALVLALGVRPEVDPVASEEPPVESELSRTDLACPEAVRGAGAVRVADVDGEAGEVSLVRAEADGERGEPSPLRIRSGQVAEQDVSGAAVVTGTGAMAPGLLAGRAGGSGLAATTCPVAGTERWFAGLGARATRGSVIELVNPDRGVAVVDVDVWSPSGPVEVGALRGVSVPGRSVVRLDLSDEVPTRRTLGARVVVNRGRVAASVRDREDPIARGRELVDWLPGQAEPAEDSLVTGLAAGGGSRNLMLVNPGEDEARVRLQLVSEESTFSPTGVEEVRVPAESFRRVALGWLGPEVGEGALGLRVTSTQPVAASVRSVIGGDLVTAAPSPGVESTGGAVLPGSGVDDARLVLAGADAEGQVRVVARAAGGRELLSRRVAVAPDRATEIDLPAAAGLVTVSPEGTGIQGTVLLQGPGSAAVPVVEPQRVGLVPSVRPAGP